jgi:hypothetical protein
VFLNVAGSVADRLIASGMAVGRVRKLMQTIGFGGLATALAWSVRESPPGWPSP